MVNSEPLSGSAEAKVSVIVPVKNEVAYIRLCIESLLSQDFPGDQYEVIVVDNGSTDGTLDILSEYEGRIKIVHSRATSVGGVRNDGVQCARGKYLAFLDGDCEAGCYWIKNGIDGLEKLPMAGAVGGPYVAPSDANWIARTWLLPNETITTRETKYLAAGCIFIDRVCFESVGRFPEEMAAGEDVRICTLIKKLGKKVYFVDGCQVVHHGNPETIIGFVKRERWHGSDVMRSNNGINDKVFMGVIVFILSIFTSILVFPFERSASVWFIFFSMVPVLSFDLKRMFKVYADGHLNFSLFWLVAQSLPLSLAYFVGRTLGFYDSIKKEFAGCS